MTSLPAANEAVILMKPDASSLVISLSSWQGALLTQKTAEVQVDHLLLLAPIASYWDVSCVLNPGDLQPT